MTDTEKRDSDSPIPLPTRHDNMRQDWLRSLLIEIEEHVGKDILMISGNIQTGVGIRVRLALDRIENRKDTLLVILNTPGGSIVETKLIVETLRNFYDTVHFLVPVQAMSAGTVLVMSGDAIYMDYFSKLGPIDPQISKGGSYVPALSYLRQYNYMREKAEKGKLTNADVILLNKLDLAELDNIELIKRLSESLITDWLSRYKFKDWKKDGHPVNDKMKKQRAKAIAEKLNDQERWFVHDYGIHKNVLQDDLKLKIDDYSEDAKLKSLIWRYFWAISEYVGNGSFVHSKDFA